MNANQRQTFLVFSLALTFLSLASCTKKEPTTQSQPKERSSAATDPFAQSPPPNLAAALSQIASNPTAPGPAGMVLVAIKPGKFVMGSPDDEFGRDEDETAREVVVEMPFYISIHEVTQGQWQSVMSKNPSRFEGTDLPVEQVSLNDALAFAKKLSARDNMTYRLPTEAEWEYAARAGTTTAYHMGARLTPRDGNVRSKAASGGGLRPNDGVGKTTPVGQYGPNAWGLFDAHGNVWEWTAEGVLRGGGWSFSPTAARSAARLELGENTRYDVNGLRLVREVLTP